MVCEQQLCVAGGTAACAFPAALSCVRLLQVQVSFLNRSHTGRLSQPIAVDEAPVTSTRFHLNFSALAMSEAHEFLHEEFCSGQEDF